VDRVPAENPVVLDGDVSETKLRLLLDLSRESPDLDYKGACDLDQTGDLVELVKDLGAMMMDGGYLVIGANGSGQPTGNLAPTQAGKFDEAKLRPKLGKYIEGPISLSSQTHEINGKIVVLLFVAPSDEGFGMFKCTGQYAGSGGTPRVVFRAGEIFHRNGTSSERLDRQGLLHLLDISRRRIREEERAEFERHLQSVRAELDVGYQAASIAEGPATGVGFELPEDVFDETVTELMRQHDSIPLKRLIRRAPQSVAELMSNDEWEPEVARVLDRLAGIAALALFVDEDQWLDEVVSALTRVYASKALREHSVEGARLWLQVIERVVALGGLAVRLNKWAAVRTLVLQRPPGMEDYYTNWLRHALTWAARMNQLVEVGDEKRVQLSLIILAKSVAERVTALHPDIPTAGDALLSSLTQFDFLACLVAISAADGQAAGGSFYPNFARFYNERTEPIIEQLISDGQGPMRQAIFPGTDAELARAIVWLSETATKEAFSWNGWMYINSQKIRVFVEQHAELLGK
jgi:hypothetical protein